MKEESGVYSVMLKTAGATLLWGALHSLLASRATKQKATQIWGERNRNGWFRMLYNVQALLTFGALIFYLWRLPGRVIYRVKNQFRWLMHIGQIASVLFALWGMWHLGILRVAGISSLASWFNRSKQNVEPEPDGQGPKLNDDGKIQIVGPYRYCRHPLNFAPLPLLWLMPKMTTKLFAFNLAMTIYAWLASFHEEDRLCKTYGEAYEEYAQSEIPFFLPCPIQKTNFDE